MRLTVNFVPESKSIQLPIAYNSLLQGFIYNHLDRALAGWLHERGIASGKRSFRFFTFSRLLGSYRINYRAAQLAGPILSIAGGLTDI